MRVNPEEIRYRYQYARALEIDDPKKALKIPDGYVASYDNAGSILIERKFRKPLNISTKVCGAGTQTQW